MNAGGMIEAGYKFARKNQWQRVLREIANDFCVPQYMINKIITKTQLDMRTDDQEILYRNAHRTLMTYIDNKWKN